MPTCPNKKITILGAGSWGTAIAMHLARLGHDVILWGRSKENIDNMHANRVNTPYLPGVRLPSSLKISHELQAAVRHAELLLFSVPSSQLEGLAKRVQDMVSEACIIGWLTKGVIKTDQKPGWRFCDVMMRETFGEKRPMILVSGPSFAIEVAKGQWTGLTIAGSSADVAANMAELFHGGHVVAEAQSDMIAAQLAGVMKNIMAIAGGVCGGMSWGDNAHSLLYTLGVQESMLLVEHLGGSSKSLMRYAGIGDMLLSASSSQSRNYQLGYRHGIACRDNACVESSSATCEGAKNVAYIASYALDQGLSMPVVQAVNSMLQGDIEAKDLLSHILAHSVISESLPWPNIYKKQSDVELEIS